MKRILLGTIAAVILAVAIVSFGWSKTNTCDTVIRMVEKGATEPEMLSFVNGSNREALNADDVIKLKHAGVPNNVVFEMLHKSGTQ